jgi:3-oxoacyl-[acyl-carrier protein] reductase
MSALQGKTALVTGASKGIGLAIARQLYREGASVMLVASDPTRLAAACDSFTGPGPGQLAWAAADLRELAGAESVLATFSKEFSGCDILIHSAGATRGGVFPDQPDSEYLDGFALKFHGGVRMARLFWPMLKASSGTLINIIGGAARSPDAGFMVGGAVNAALANFSKALAAQGLQDDVNVNWIHPGQTETERLAMLFETRAAQEGRTAEQVRAERIADEGIRRLGQPEDVAQLAVFLCRPEARHIHGSGLTVDGGATKGYY